jgi:hypothetical protein
MPAKFRLFVIFSGAAGGIQEKVEKPIQMVSLNERKF